MAPIMVEQRPSTGQLERLGVADWPIWCCEASAFDQTYERREVCYLLEGRAVITPADGGAPIEIGAGDLVLLPAGSSCRWEVLQPLRKHYRLG